MTKNKVKRPRRGRPATGYDPAKSIRMPESLLEAIGKWQRIRIDRPKLTISDAVRELVTRGLIAEGTIKE